MEPATTNMPPKKSRQKWIIVIGIVALIAVVIGAVCIRGAKNNRNKMIREAFEEYIDSTVREADRFDTDRHPVRKGVTITNPQGEGWVDENCDKVWIRYAIEDFDGDGQPELMVHRDNLIRSDFAEDTLCMFEYSDGSVIEGRENESTNFLDYGSAEFYQTGIAIKSYEDGSSFDVLAFNDNHSDLFGTLPGRAIVTYYKDDETGNYVRYNPSHYRSGWGDPPDKTLTPEEFEAEMESLRTSADGKLLEPMDVDFRDIVVEPAAPAETADDDEEAAWLSRIEDMYLNSSSDLYPIRYLIEDFDNDGSKECILHTIRDGEEKLEGCFDSSDDGDIHQTVFPLQTAMPFSFDELVFYNNGMAIGKKGKGDLNKEYVFVSPVIQGNQSNSDVRKKLGINEGQYILYFIGYDDQVEKHILESDGEYTGAGDSLTMTMDEYSEEISIITGGAEVIEPEFHKFSFVRPDAE